MIPVTLRPSMIQAFSSGEGKPLDDYYERLRRQILGEIIRPENFPKNPADATGVKIQLPGVITSSGATLEIDGDSDIPINVPKVKTKIPLAVWIVAGAAVAWIFLKGRKQ